MQKIELEDLQNLNIEKKLIQVYDTTLYSDEAYQYLKNLVDFNRSILFEKNTHRIYALGNYYGGDELKENLLYFSKLLSIDIDGTIINEIDAIQNSDTLGFKAKDNVSLNMSRKNNYVEIEIGYDINNIVDTSIISINNNEYNLNVENGKIKFNEYIAPIITLDDYELTYENFDANNKKELNLKINSSKDINTFTLFEITGNDCVIKNINGINILIEATKDVNPIINIRYDDGIKSNYISFTIEWTVYCYYGVIDKNLKEDNLIENGKYSIKNNSIENNIKITQELDYFGYYMCPIEYNPYFIDNLSKIQGAWHKFAIVERNLKDYMIYVTDNSGLGETEWYIINKN